MSYLILGMMLFVGGHVFTAMRNTRQLAIIRLGEMGYKAVYSVVALAGVGLMVLGMRSVEPVYLWAIPAWANQATGVMMIISFILVAANKAPTNIKRLTRHPMSWGIVVWSAAHLLSNGKLSSLILFGGLAAYSLFAMWSADRRGVPAQPERQPPVRDVAVIAIGLVAYAAVRYFHP